MKGRSSNSDESRRPSEEHDAHQLLEAQYSILEQRQDLAWLGRLFGGKAAAPTNIAGLVILLCFLFVGASLVLPSSDELAEARKLALAIISSAMAYIFGAASKR